MKNGTLVLALVSLVLLGFAAGYGTHFLLTKKHVEQVARLATGGGFTERMLHLLDPSEIQEAEILPILEQHEKMVDSLSGNYRDYRRHAMDQLRKELVPLLTVEQKDRLAEHFQRMKKRFRKHAPHHHKEPRKKRLRRLEEGK